MEEKKLCEYCGKVEADEGYPVCRKCFIITMQWGTPAQKQRMKYYLQKEQMEKDPALKDRVLAARKTATQKYYQNNKEKISDYRKMYIAEHPEQVKETRKRYMQSHREQWNAYQREYKKRKAAENRAIREELAQLKKQLAMTGVDK